MHRSALLLLALALSGCPDESDKPAHDSDTEVTETDDTNDTQPTETDTDVEPTCSGADLCERSIDECEAEITMDACLAFYDPATSSCADVVAYEACNCDCIGEATCDGYFGCGEICFEDHCQVSLR